MRSAKVGMAFLAAVVAAGSCSQVPKRFPLAEPLWEDPDRNHVTKRPGKYFSGLMADGADLLVFRTLAKFWWFELEGEAKNVNSVDEVPNSSWFHNRIGLFPISPAQAARAACDSPPPDPKQGPWIVSAAKPDGANPGFFVKTKQGTFLLKFDGDRQPERATTADVIGSKIFWAAGYHTPCNRVVYFDQKILKIAKKSKVTDRFGRNRPITEADVETVLKMGFRLKNGLVRASASKFIKGRPIGPFRYEGTRSDDPNDVIAHEDRRDLRGMRLLSAWLNHFDSREQNTLNMWVKDRGRTYIRHYIIDWGDSFGSRWGWDGLSRRLGHSNYFDLGHMIADMFTLGAIKRPWHKVKMHREAPTFAYFTAKHFVPSKWRPGYTNPAYARMTFSDALWMTRIISRFSDAHVKAIVKTARITDPRAEKYLVRTLILRRDAILREYLTKYAPLDRFRLVRRTKGNPRQSLCFEDLALRHRIVPHADVRYKLTFYGGKKLDDRLGWLHFRPDPDHPHRSCVVLPLGFRRPSKLAGSSARDDHPLRYGILKIFIFQKPSVKPTSEMWLHFYDLGTKRGFRLVGLHRLPEPIFDEKI